MTSSLKQCVTFRQTTLPGSSPMRIIEKCLPEQGAIELQNDHPNKEHAWHSHETHETIVILEGQLLFKWDGGEKLCEQGEVIDLPKGEHHSSKAMESGARYIIAFHKAENLE